MRHHRCSALTLGTVLSVLAFTLLTTKTAQAETTGDSESSAVTASDTQTETVTPAAVSSPIPTPAPQPKAKTYSEKEVTALTQSLKDNCDRHFPGQIQAELRSACSSAAKPFTQHGKKLTEIHCRLEYGEDPRLVMACLIGSNVVNDMANKQDTYKKQLQLCAEHYPAHTEIDAFLQESCLTGIHMPTLVNETEKLKLEMCSQVTPERSFLGPCAVGLSLAKDLNPAAQPSKHNQACERYFDHRQFHTGYRACLNARALALNWTGKHDDVIRVCGDIVSNSTSDTERAACIVGVGIHHHLAKQSDITTQFEKCGDNKVSYQDRNFLACLTAASLLEFTDKQGAASGCNAVFKDRRSKSLSECRSSLSKL